MALHHELTDYKDGMLVFEDCGQIYRS